MQVVHVSVEESCLDQEIHIVNNVKFKMKMQEDSCREEWICSPVKSAYFGMSLGTIDGWNPRVAYIHTNTCTWKSCDFF